ncbi:toprim domain-containing protein (plasmid) [Paraburkholderia sp. PREW-6R]|uniref:toprim domain-containing protein n=1 Tax=Paraburkholderia sp. PREW-6R TaxID=3141544 RepID=UPI0031F56EA5
MPTIPIAKEELERLKSEVSLKRLIESQGHELVRRGKDWVMRCVFHEDATPSLVITESNNLYHCFGCGAGGSVLDWVMKTQGVSLPHAVQLLKHGAPLDGDRVGVARSSTRPLPSLADDAADDQALLARVVDYYHATLKENTLGLAYLAGRGLNHPELIERFRLGYGNSSLTYRLPRKHTIAGKAVREQLQRLGVLRATGYEQMGGCVIVPVLGEDDEDRGRVWQLYGRRTADAKMGRDEVRHLYLGAPLRGVWNASALAADREIIVCESLIDAMTFWCAGYRNVIAAYGVNGFTDDHRAALKRHGTQRVLIAYDRDDAGNAAAQKLSTELLESGIECFRVLFPKGMDANEYARKVQPAQKSLGLLLQQSEWLGKGQRPGVAAVVHPAPGLAAREEAVPVEPVAPLLPAPAIAHAPEPANTAPLLAAHAELEPALPRELPPVPASTPATPPAEPVASEGAAGELLLAFGERHWRIRGWQKNLGPDQMRVNVQVRNENGYHVDTLDVYSAKQRAAFIRQAAAELGSQDDTVKRDLGRVLLKLETLQDGAITAALAPKDAAPSIDEAQQRSAMDLLKSPDLVERIVADMDRCGIVGESANLLAGYLAAVSRKLDAPLAILIQSTSAAGKSSLMDAVLNLMPDEERIQYSAMTGQSLFYLGETDLQHKILAIAEEEGVRQAAYALKLLQSDGELTIASTGKDEATGNLVTKQYRVKGPVMLMLTTTAIDVDEELLNRCLVLTINETREQTRAIHARQRVAQTLEGLLAGADREAITELHRNAQRLLKPVHVVNPFAHLLTFLDDKTRMRRDHVKYLTLIRSIALLHQHQREVKRVQHRGQTLEYIEVTREDIALANRIAHDVLGRTLDELPPQTRRLLTLLADWVTGECAARDETRAAFRFTRRDVRAATSWGDTQLKIHLSRLVELEYMISHRGRNGTFEYELLYSGEDDGRPHLCGLLDPEKLTGSTGDLTNTESWSGSESERSGSGRASVGARSAPENPPQSHAHQGEAAEPVGFARNAVNPANGAPLLAAGVRG